MATATFSTCAVVQLCGLKSDISQGPGQIRKSHSAYSRLSSSARPSSIAAPAPTSKEAQAIAEAAARLSKRRQRVQVTVKVADGACQIGHKHSDGRGWSAQVNDAFGTTSDDFAHLVFHQTMGAVSPSETLQQQTMNAMLAAIDGAGPKDEIEAMLASQMAVTHSLGMEFLGRAKRAQLIAGVEGIVASDDDLTTARKLYRAAADANPGRVVILCAGGRILARSDEPDSMRA
jgi:hypothetical protein